MMQATRNISWPVRRSDVQTDATSDAADVTGGGVSTLKWFVLHTKPRQEKAVARAMEAMAVEHVLPLREKVRYERRRKVRSELPLFPGYVFLRGTVEQAYAADRTGRIAQVIHVVDQQRITQELEHLQYALEQGGALQPTPYLQAGRRVVVISGPFQGIVGVVEAAPINNRLVLQVETLGQAASLEIDSDLLELID